MRMLTGAEDEEGKDMNKFKRVIRSLIGVTSSKEAIKNAADKKTKKIENLMKNSLIEGSGALEMASALSEQVQNFRCGLQIALQI